MAHVLLIEPDIILARTYTHALQHAKHTVAHATNAQEAINQADMHVPDVVVLELQLAGHDGIEFLHEFRSYSEWQHVPVIVNTYLHQVTVGDMRTTLQQNLGVADCLYKPRATLQQLIRAVNEQAGS